MKKIIIYFLRNQLYSIYYKYIDKLDLTIIYINIMNLLFYQSIPILLIFNYFIYSKIYI